MYICKDCLEKLDRNIKIYPYTINGSTIKDVDFNKEINRLKETYGDIVELERNCDICCNDEIVITLRLSEDYERKVIENKMKELYYRVMQKEIIETIYGTFEHIDDNKLREIIGKIYDNSKIQEEKIIDYENRLSEIYELSLKEEE